MINNNLTKSEGLSMSDFPARVRHGTFFVPNIFTDCKNYKIKFNEKSNFLLSFYMFSIANFIDRVSHLNLFLRLL